ncbi:hypothetical protein SBA3_2320007 [Candidatus Sulfopaludibacter sp. SbA3]|nr:hypothetical protein SBA3_2320007 [Candidatus Sulfopaludibacter sp. SbA3]
MRPDSSTSRVPGHVDCRTLARLSLPKYGRFDARPLPRTPAAHAGIGGQLRFEERWVTTSQSISAWRR